MIARHLVVDKDDEVYGAPTLAPPSQHYLDSINATNVGLMLRKRQPFRVVRLVEDPTFTPET
jgi:hypothetical protein